MTFDEWWSQHGCREECLTHEDRARQAWQAAQDEIIDALALVGETEGDEMASEWQDDLHGNS